MDENVRRDKHVLNRPLFRLVNEVVVNSTSWVVE